MSSIFDPITSDVAVDSLSDLGDEMSFILLEVIRACLVLISFPLERH